MARKNSKRRLTINELTLIIAMASIILTVLAIALTNLSKLNIKSTNKTAEPEFIELTGTPITTTQTALPPAEIPETKFEIFEMSYLSSERDVIQAFRVDDYAEPTVEFLSAKAEATSISSSPEFVLTKSEFDLVVQMVQHEVGSDPSVFPGYDFDLIQRYMARTVLNRLGMHNWDTVQEVITAPNQFCSLQALSRFSPDEPTTRRNVLAVVNGEDGLPDDVLYEMSWEASTSPEEAKRIMEKQVGRVYGEVYFYCNWGSDYSRLLMFARQDS